MTEQPPLILASGSSYRKQQLQSLMVDFSVKAPDIDESPLPQEGARDLAARLAKAKALKIHQVNPTACVIGSDQVCGFDGKIFGKPGTHEKAVEQLQTFSDNRVEFFTALSVLSPDGAYQSTVDLTVVEFRRLSLDEINRYIDKEQPLDCAGAFKVEALGLSLFNAVESNDPSALVGLPLIKLAAFLRHVGYTIP